MMTQKMLKKTTVSLLLCLLSAGVVFASPADTGRGNVDGAINRALNKKATPASSKTENTAEPQYAEESVSVLRGNGDTEQTEQVGATSEINALSIDEFVAKYLNPAIDKTEKYWSLKSQREEPIDASFQKRIKDYVKENDDSSEAIIKTQLHKYGIYQQGKIQLDENENINPKALNKIIQIIARDIENAPDGKSADGKNNNGTTTVDTKNGPVEMPLSDLLDTPGKKIAAWAGTTVFSGAVIAKAVPTMFTKAATFFGTASTAATAAEGATLAEATAAASSVGPILPAATQTTTIVSGVDVLASMSSLGGAGAAEAVAAEELVQGITLAETVGAGEAGIYAGAEAATAATTGETVVAAGTGIGLGTIALGAVVLGTCSAIGYYGSEQIRKELDEAEDRGGMEAMQEVIDYYS